MHAIDDLVANMNFSSGDGVSTVWAKVYANWITDEVIDVELIRNVILALISVMVCTLILIANIPICFYIFVSVLLTLVRYIVHYRKVVLFIQNFILIFCRLTFAALCTPGD